MEACRGCSSPRCTVTSSTVPAVVTPASMPTAASACPGKLPGSCPAAAEAACATATGQGHTEKVVTCKHPRPQALLTGHAGSRLSSDDRSISRGLGSGFGLISALCLIQAALSQLQRSCPAGAEKQAHRHGVSSQVQPAFIRVRKLAACCSKSTASEAYKMVCWTPLQVWLTAFQCLGPSWSEQVKSCNGVQLSGACWPDR